MTLYGVILPADVKEIGNRGWIESYRKVEKLAVTDAADAEGAIRNVVFRSRAREDSKEAIVGCLKDAHNQCQVYEIPEVANDLEDARARKIKVKKMSLDEKIYLESGILAMEMAEDRGTDYSACVGQAERLVRLARVKDYRLAKNR